VTGLTLNRRPDGVRPVRVDCHRQFAYGGPVLSAHEPVTLLSDESFIGRRYVAFGAIILPTRLLPQADALLQSYCQRRGLGAREMAFKKCSAGEVDRYVGYVDEFWSLRERGIPLDFRAMVIDTRRNPLKAPQYGCDTDEAGFYRMYHQFITCSVEKVAPGATHYELIVARTDDSYAHRSEILGKTVSGALRQRLGSRFGVCGLTRDDPAKSRTHQLVDVMLGAVTHAYNPCGSTHKLAIRRHIEERAGRSLDSDFLPSERPVNVWHFASRGRARWASGSQGVA